MDNIGLNISFPKSDQDHRLQLVEVNGAMFAIVYAPLESEGPIQLDCKEWSLILLAPIKSKADVVINGINIIRLSSVESAEGIVDIQASNRLASLAPPAQSRNAATEEGKSGTHRLDDDSGAFLNFFQLFNKIVENVHEDNQKSLKEAQKRFLGGICALAEKVDAQGENLNMQRVLEIWDIPVLS